MVHPRAGQYGATRAAALFQSGDYEAAIAAATEDFEKDRENPEHLVDRARAAAVLERFDIALGDLDLALELDDDAAVLDSDIVDDAYFSALLGAARMQATTSREAAVKVLERYRRRWPTGSHHDDVAVWTRRLLGEVRTEWTKERA
jgi:tetratricopeptide (TPR) repeat protein